MNKYKGKNKVIIEVINYLNKTKDKYQIGTDEYYARIALELAMNASISKNYGIGAVIVNVTGDQIFEYYSLNKMATGVGVVDHAETRGLIRFAEDSESYDNCYSKNTNKYTKSLKEGIYVFGSLEPCPLCVSAMTNSAIVRSVSTAKDGALITKDGYKISDGAANAISYKDKSTTFDKSKIQPLIWQQIQNEGHMRFDLLITDDKELLDLSLKIFLVNRAEIDEYIAHKHDKKVAH